MGNRECVPWTDDEEAVLRLWYGRCSRADLAERLPGRTVPSISNRAGRLGLRGDKGPDWSEEEIFCLRELFWAQTPQAIAKRLGRTINAVRVKAKKIGLRQRARPELTPNQISGLLNICPKQVLRWVRRRLLSARCAPTFERRIWLIRRDDLIEFLRAHPELWDARRCPNVHLELGLRASRPVDIMATLGHDEAHGRLGRQDRPVWLRDKLADDIARGRARKRWTPAEDTRLRDLLRLGVGYREIGGRLGRTEAAVDHRVRQLGRRLWQGSAMMQAGR